MEIVDLRPAGRCRRLLAGNIEALVTLDVGPRIIAFGPIGGPSMLKVYPEGGSLGDDGMKHYGGHRLWYGPEDRKVTYQPDNDPVEITEYGEWTGYASRTNRFGIQKEIRIATDLEREALKLCHVVTNRSEESVALFPWALTVMAPGGTCLFPLPPFRAHTEDLLPAAALVLWSYTRLSDPRWTWGSRVARLTQQNAPTPQKVGALVKQGYAAYANHGHVFFKRFSFDSGSEYPDLGCNFETFTNAEMLEVESVGPMVRLMPGESVQHWETWYLVQDAAPPAGDKACGDWLEELASQRPLLK